MREPRNPFHLRASENIESDATFLRLFAPGMLDVLSAEQPWERVHILRSAPGGGKTSLMRLFTPNVLLSLYAYRLSEDCKDLYQRVRELGAIADHGPRLLGVMLSCARNYATLADLDLDQARQDRLLFSLLNARIILATLRAALAIRRLEYPANLDKLTLAMSETDETVPGLNLPCAGRGLYNWARELESTVYEAIDSFGPEVANYLPGHDTLLSLSLLRPDRILIDGSPVAEHLVVMLDDVHKLTRQQRQRLIQTAIDMRSSTGIWISERFEALSADEVLSSGALQGRDYEKVILLERFWHDNSRRKRFENLVLNIADRRALSAPDVEIGSFTSSLQASLDGPEWQPQFSHAVEEVSARVKKLSADRRLFQGWVATRESAGGIPSEQAIGWRSLEILMQREISKVQTRFDFVALTAEQLQQEDGPDVRAAAELFLAEAANLPYYFGSSRLAATASSNIQQFLWLAGEEFEEVLAAALIKKPIDLPPARQEAILKKAARAQLDGIPQRMQNGREVMAFINAVGQFARWATYRPTAPYAPGVTGIAISMADRDRLRDPRYLEVSPDRAKLAAILASAIAYNLFEPILDHKCKGERWMVLYLNRLLCVQFHLPLQYGGWKERSLRQLETWLQQGFTAPAQAEIPAI